MLLIQTGVVIDGRFELGALAGKGGMGAVFEALDRSTGEKVAFKIMTGASEEERERFDREARVLAGFAHPAIVRYVAHGLLDSGEPYLAMEWLSGEGLDARLARERLGVEETLTVAERIAAALAAAHARGVIHRDIKPSNLFLRDGDPRRATLLDFGIARCATDSHVVTRTGVFMGTPGYVAPEQARGDRSVNARADVFALGCVLFECLVGKPAFTGRHVVAVLAKVLFEEVPRISALRPGVPFALEALIGKMLAKQPEERLADGEAVAAALARVASGEVMSEPPHTLRSRAALGSGEQRLVSVILVSATTQDDGVIDPTAGTVASLGATPLPALRATARSYGARVEPLLDGSAALLLAGAGMATDLVAQAARCALALRAVVPRAPMVLVTGRGVLSGTLPVGEGIDRAARLLREEESYAEMTPPASDEVPGQTRAQVRLDELTAELLEGRFEMITKDGARALVGEAQSPEGARLLLGRVTPYVGREREFSTLSAFYDECTSEPAARVVLVTGAAGIGKSRIRHELVHKLANADPRPEIWFAQGDPTRTGAPFGLAAELLRRASSLHEEDPIEVRREKIRATVMRHLGLESARVAELYGELVGAPWPDEASTLLREARRDPVLMGEQLRRAFEDFVSAACATRPVLIVLDDLHWADLPSVQLVDAALRLAREKPLFVLALARPDVHDRFPGLWTDRGVQEIRLGELPRRASEKLARHVLGDEAPPSLLARLVAQAAGNPFYLEELLRAVAEGRETSLPKTVMAMLQARLEALPAEARWLLRAGSIFGETFWSGGVRVLLGGEKSVVDVDRWIGTLVHRELLTRRRESRFVGEDELAFRHDLLREAAYEALTEADRALGHRLVAEWLEGAGERDAMVLAEHCERGEERDKAASYFAGAATQALSANDFEAVLERSERAEACGASGSQLGEVRQAQAEAHFYRGELAEAARRAREAMELLSPDSPLWFGAASAAAWAESSRGERRQLLGIAEAMLGRADREASPLARQLASMGWIARMLLRSGQLDAAQKLADRFTNAAEDTRRDPIVAAEWSGFFATRALALGDLEAAHRFFLESAGHFEEAKVPRFGISMRIYAAMAIFDLGEHAEAEEQLAALAVRADASCLPMLAASARHGLAEALAARGKLAEARAGLEDILETLAHAGLTLSANDVRQFLALVLVRLGDSESAERAAIEAVALVDAPPNRRCSYLATLARVLIACGRPAEALSAAEEAMVLLDEVGVLLSDEPLVRLVYAKALHGNGRIEDAHAALAAAREHVLRRAAKITDAVRRARFLSAVPDNARTLELAEEWLGAKLRQPSPAGSSSSG